MRPLRGLLYLLVACFAGCASLAPVPEPCVTLGPGAYLCPLPPAELPPVQAAHVVTLEQDGKRDSFLGQLQIDANSLQLTGASLFGTPLFSVRWDGQALTSVPAHSALRPDLMLAMLEVALAEPAQLRTHLHGVQLAVRQTPDGEVRTLHAGDRLVAEITRRGAPLAAARLEIRIPRVPLMLRLEPLSEATP